MQFLQMIKAIERPSLYEPGTAAMWTDPHISRQLLALHLNEGIDLASRRAATIDGTVQWIAAQTGPEPLTILDLGCGPGLYAQRLARLGHRVTGVDFSETSIAYAREQARIHNLDIAYRHQDYLTLEEEGQYDLVLLIYTDFGVLLPDQRERLLARIHRALKPGGRFIFDVLGDRDLALKATPKSWELAPSGFWRNRPYAALSESFLYPEDKVILYQHLILEETGAWDVYRFWTHFFSDSDLELLLGRNGFQTPRFDRDVLPGGDLWSGEHVTFCVAPRL